MGIYLVKQTMDAIAYEYKFNQNILTIQKRDDLKEPIMKKTMTLVLAALLILGGMAFPGMTAAEDEFKTLGDVFPYVPDSAPIFENVCICVFEKDGVYYRVEADVPNEIIERIDNLEWDETYDDQVRELLKDLPIKRVMDFSAFLLTQADLDALVGKTGQELLDMGFVPMEEYDFGETETRLVLAKGVFDYEVCFAEAVAPQRVPNLAEIVAPLTVKSAAFLGELNYYAWEPEFDPEGGPVYEYIAPPSFRIPEISVEESPFKTLADVLTAEKGSWSSSTTEDMFIIAFELNGSYYRVEAALPEEIGEQLEAIDFFDEEKEQKELALLGALPVTRVGDLSACRPSQEALDALVGKTGRELVDMGFEQGMGYSFWDKAEFYLIKDLFEYHVYFNEKVPEMEDYDAVLDEILASLTVEKAEVFGLSGVCSDPDLIW